MRITIRAMWQKRDDLNKQILQYCSELSKICPAILGSKLTTNWWHMRLAVHLKNYLWSHHRTLKAKVPCDLSSAYSPDNTNILQWINTKLNIDIAQPGTK